MIWLATALAAVPGQDGYTPPEASVDLYRPSVDADTVLATENTAIQAPFVVGAQTVYLRDALTWTWPDGTEAAVLGDALALHLSAAWATSPVRIGVNAPAYLHTSGAFYARSKSVLGDPSLDAKVRIVDGIAAIGRLGYGMGGAARQLGTRGVSAELGVAADLNRGPWWAGANVLLRAGADQTLHRTRLGETVVLRVAGSRDLGEVAVGLETLSHLRLTGGPVPVELLGSAHVPLRRSVLTVGLGTGLTGAVGAPSLRLVLGLRGRQVEEEGRALPSDALEVHRAPVELDDGAGDGQAQSGS